MRYPPVDALRYLVIATLAAAGALARPARAEDWFGPPITSDIPTRPHQVAYGFFDADSHLDVAYVEYLTILRVYSGSSTGEFAPTWTWSGCCSGLGAGDVDGDTDDDLVIGCGPNLRVFWNPHDGTSPWPQSIVHQEGLQASHVTVTDLDIDGYADVLVSGGQTYSPDFEEQGGFYVLWGSASGPTVPSTYTRVSMLGSPGCAGWVTATEVFDIEEDGLPDLVVSVRSPTPCNESGCGVKVVRQSSLRFFTEDPSWVALEETCGTDWYTDLDTGDVDGDGDPDLLVVDGKLYRFRNDGDAQFVPVGAPLTEPSGFAVACADLNGDAKDDVVWSDDGWTTVYRGSAAFDLPFVQYVDYGSDFPHIAPVLPGDAHNLIGRGSTAGVREFGVWPDLVQPVGIWEQPPVEKAGHLSVVPAVWTESVAEIHWAGAADAAPSTLRVHDVLGRELRRLDVDPAGSGPLAIWDARTTTGAPVGAGIYWIVGESSGRVCRARITVVR